MGSSEDLYTGITISAFDDFDLDEGEPPSQSSLQVLKGGAVGLADTALLQLCLGGRRLLQYLSWSAALP